MTLLAPGLWLQRLTTREPSLDQIEVSVRALQEVMRVEQAESEGELRQSLASRSWRRGEGCRARVAHVASHRKGGRWCRESFVEAGVRWEGNLARGTGTISASSSRAFIDLPFGIASRIATAPDMTSPEELLAAAHAGCFTTSLAGS